MGCGCGTAAKAQVHPDPTSVVPTAASSSSKAEEPAETATAPPTTPCSALESGGAARTEPAAEPAAESAGAAAPTIEQPATEPGPRKPKKSLVKAAKENNIELIDELLRSGAALEDLGMWDNTPLLVACMYGHSEAALRLISAKANVRARNEHDATPMHYASVEGMQGVVETLLATTRADGGEPEVTKLVNCGHVKVYNRHLDAYAKRTPLCSAAESGFAEVAGILLAAGAVLEDADEEGRTALWLAARHSRLSAVRLLLQHGADPSIKDSKGVSVLEASMADAKKINEELVLALLSNGIQDVNDTTGSPLRDAVKAGKRGVVEALLTNGASIELKPGSAGSMPLHEACQKGDEYLVGLLVRSRADPSLSDAAGLTAFDLLRRRGLPDGQIVQLLSPPTPGGNDGSTGATGETAEATATSN